MQARDKLAGIDLSSPTGGDEAYERLQADKESSEWLMLLRDLHASMVLDAVEGNDAVQAAHHALYVGLLHGLTVVTDPYFEGMATWRVLQYMNAVLLQTKFPAKSRHLPNSIRCSEKSERPRYGRG